MLLTSVEATTTDMTKFPRQAVQEVYQVEYVCKTDSAYPEPPVVLWHLDDVPVDVYHENTVENKASRGQYYGQKTQSTLRFRAGKDMNKKKVKCVLGNDQTKFSEQNLTVLCKYLLVYVYQMT